MSDIPHNDDYRNEPTPLPNEGSLTNAPRPGLISSSSAPGGARASEVWAESASAAEAPVESSGQSAAPTPTVELSDVEARVLGSLIEKSYLTPDAYPMTTNALVNACNQKTNRDPVVDYSAVQVDSTFLDLRQRNLVRRVHTPGSRSTKHRQTLDEVLSLNPRELALVSVLLLRGPQTINELRIRTERHDVGCDDLDAVEGCLTALSSRPHPLVRELPRQPGHKENRWVHLLHDPTAVPTEPLVASPTTTSQTTASAAPVSVPGAAAPAAAVIDNHLDERIEALEAEVATLRRQLASLAEKLGEPLDE